MWCQLMEVNSFQYRHPTCMSLVLYYWILAQPLIPESTDFPSCYDYVQKTIQLSSLQDTSSQGMTDCAFKGCKHIISFIWDILFLAILEREAKPLVCLNQSNAFHRPCHYWHFSFKLHPTQTEGRWGTARTSPIILLLYHCFCSNISSRKRGFLRANERVRTVHETQRGMETAHSQEPQSEQTKTNPIIIQMSCL